LILTRILVGGGGRGYGMHRGKRCESKMAHMSPDERKKWKEEVGATCAGAEVMIWATHRPQKAVP